MKQHLTHSTIAKSILLYVVMTAGVLLAGCASKPSALDDEGNLKKGCMKYTVKLSPTEMLRTCAGETMDSTLEQIMLLAEAGSADTAKDYFACLCAAANDGNVLLAQYFAGRYIGLHLDDDNENVCSCWKEHWGYCVERTYQVILDRLDSFCQPCSYDWKHYTPAFEDSTELTFYLTGVKSSKTESINKMIQVRGDFNIWCVCDEEATTALRTALNEFSEHQLGSLISASSSPTELGVADVKDMERIDRLLAQAAEAGVYDPKEVKVAWGLSKVCGTADDNTLTLYALNVGMNNGKPLMEGPCIANAKVDSKDNSVRVVFTSEGKEQFRTLTRDHFGHQIAFTLDDVVLSAPFIMRVTEGGEFVLSGCYSKETAQECVAILKSGRLPVCVEIVSMQSGALR